MVSSRGKSWNGSNRRTLPIDKINMKSKHEDICSRLGALVLNHRTNSIRITPSRGNKFEPGFFEKKLSGIRDWVNAAIQGATKVCFPELLDVVIELEKPRDSDPFEMVWVKFNGHENLWDLKFMMMGVKMGRFSGFPKELFGLENKLWVSRDRRSESERRASLL